MASRLRYIVKWGGGFYAGARVRELLQRSGVSFGDLKSLTQAAKLLKAQIWVFREPRSVDYSRSRYKQICSRLGIGKRRKIVFNPPVMAVAPEGVAQDGPINFQLGFADQLLQQAQQYHAQHQGNAAPAGIEHGAAHGQPGH